MGHEAAYGLEAAERGWKVSAQTVGIPVCPGGYPRSSEAGVRCPDGGMVAPPLKAWALERL